MPASLAPAVVFEPQQPRLLDQLDTCTYRERPTFDDPMLAWAHYCADLGFRIFPVYGMRDGVCACKARHGCQNPGKHPMTHHGFKDATSDHEQIDRWWRVWPNANIGAATSGRFVVDVDPRHSGDDTLRDLIARYGALPETVTCLSGGGGEHYHFAAVDGPLTTELGAGIDVKTDGGYVLLPPSLHESGRRYVWEGAGWPDEVPLAPAPDWLIELARKKVQPALASSPVDDLISEGQRNNALASIAGSMRRRGISSEEMLPTLRSVNTNRCRPPLPDEELQTIARSVGRYAPSVPMLALAPRRPQGLTVSEQSSPNPVLIVKQRIEAGAGAWFADDLQHYSYTDLGNARRLLFLHRDNMRYCHTRSKWIIWDGQRWCLDETGRAIEFAKTVSMAVHAEIDAAPSTGQPKLDEVRRKAAEKHLKSSQSRDGLSSMLALAQSEEEIVVREDDLDADPFLLGCSNGTLDLRTGELMPHDRDYLITRVIPVEYDPAAQCPTWMRFLDRIMAGNTEMIRFLQRSVGYSLTGSTKEQLMYILHGVGRNGKSTFVETISSLLADYAMRTPTETLLAKDRDGIPNDVARLKGARFVHASEADEGRQLSEARIKDITGGDTISARFMRAEWFDFKPAFKLWLSTNHKPVIKGTDEGIWRRIRLVPFSVVIPPAEIDAELPQKLRSELPGILAWAMRGCLEWQRDGLQEPAEVLEACAGYRSEMDMIGTFIAECSVTGKELRWQATDLFKRYERWSGDQDITQKSFGTNLSSRGFERRKGTGGTFYWHGIGGKPELNERNMLQ